MFSLGPFQYIASPYLISPFLGNQSICVCVCSHVYIHSCLYNLPGSDFLNWEPLVSFSKTDSVIYWFLFLANLLYLCLIACDDHLHIREKQAYLLDSGHMAHDEYINTYLLKPLLIHTTEKEKNPSFNLRRFFVKIIFDFVTPNCRNNESHHPCLVHIQLKLEGTGKTCFFPA